jgi:tetratricopeptide (TPR) repeat protein
MVPEQSVASGARSADGLAMNGHAEHLRFRVLGWSAALWVAEQLGRAWRRIADTHAATIVGLAAIIVLGLLDHWREAGIVAGVGLAVTMVVAALNARDRLLIGEFKVSPTTAPAASDPAAGAATCSVDLANLLLVEISRLGDLFRVVGDRRAVSSELGHGAALDATLSVDALVETLQGTVSADTKATVGPISLPLAPLMTLFGRLVQAPRLTGSLHRDEDALILTAQTTRRGGLSWRVEASAVPRRPDAEPKKDEGPVLSAMVRELALRIYTDLALGRGVRWQASQRFVDGLWLFRSCLRTPKDRKVNLQRAEDLFLEALAEDEDFPLAYYNLGVVYTELHGLAVAAGRSVEAQMRLSAAETSFGRAIEKDPTHAGCYFAFAQTQFGYQRYDTVVELCWHILDLQPTRPEKAKARELLARALTEHSDTPEDYEAALLQARRASRSALRLLVGARLSHRSAPGGEEDAAAIAAALASGCLLTFSDILTRAPGGLSGPSQDRIRNRVQALARLAPGAHGKAELRFRFGMKALEGGHLELAEEELSAARRSDPTWPSYAAGLALAKAKRRPPGGTPGADAGREEVVELCYRALQGLVGAFFPSRDAEACEIVAQAFDVLGEPSTAQQLRLVAVRVEERLKSSSGGASVTGIFLEELQAASVPVSSQIGAYGEAVQQATAHLARGRRLSRHGERDAMLSQFRKALACAERARSLNPLSTVAWETLGNVYREFSDFRNARFAWEQALGTDPDNPRLYDKIGSSYWQITTDGRAHSPQEDLRTAATYFNNALDLYSSGSFEEQTLTHYRLGKLHAELREFDEARRHLEIVDAVDGRAPVVGWEQLAFAYLERRHFMEAEEYFERAIRAADVIALEPGLTPLSVIGDRLDEQSWPLGLIRVWGHLGLAITHTERDGDFTLARDHLKQASALLVELGVHLEATDADETLSTRAPAAIMECHGLILLRAGKLDKAVRMFEHAVGRFPHSRSYFGLALALEQQALVAPPGAGDRRDRVERAHRLLKHAASLRPVAEHADEVSDATDRVAHLLVANGSSGVGATTGG